MSTSITVPIGLESAPPAQEQRPESGFANGQYVPPTERTTLHKTRLGAEMAKSAARAEAAQATQQQQSQAEALGQEVASLRAQVNAFAASRLSNPPQAYSAPERDAGTLDQLRMHSQRSNDPYDGQQYDLAPDQPDPLDYVYDEAAAAEFHHLNNGYIERTVQRRLEAERATQQKAAQLQDLENQYHATQARFGRDRNFDEVLQAATHIIVASGGRTTVQDAYLQASNEIESRSGRKGSSYLPTDLKTLGAIHAYRQQTGRAR